MTSDDPDSSEAGRPREAPPGAHSTTLGDCVKKALLVALVVIVVLTGIPVVIGHGGMSCSDCSPSSVMSGVGCAATVPLAVTLVVGLLLIALRRRDDERCGLLLARSIERPPR